MPKTPPLNERIRDFLLPVAGIFVIGVVWECLHRLRVVEPSLFPGVAEILKAFTRLITTGNVLPDLGMTLMRTLSGFVLAAMIGIPIGIAIGTPKNPRRRQCPEPAKSRHRR